ncbi:MAG TPA: glycosyltransferase [Candidatus Binatia bacterium]|nr:glycosyltransferase [Candidatus Binatia bacterium]
MAGAVPWRVGYVIGGLGKGGAEYQLHELLRRLDRARFAPGVFVLDAGGFWVEPIRSLGVPVIELPRRGHRDVRRLWRLRQALRAFAPHLLQTIRWSGNSYGRIAALGLGIPVVVASERARAIRRPAWQVAVDRLLDRMTDAYLVNCEAIADGLATRERVARGKIVVVPNGIDVSALPPFALDRRVARAAVGFDPERRLVTQVGRLTPQKDHPTFLRAAALVARSRPDVDFLVVGEGAERAALEALAGELGLASRVRFLGLRHDVPALLRASDVLTLTSVFEGFPNVILEAMASGAVAVATAVDGAGEVVVSEETGLLVPPRAPDAVAAGVTRVLGDAALAERLARAARRRVETEFTVEAMARRTAAAYATWLDARGLGSVAAAA